MLSLIGCASVNPPSTQPQDPGFDPKFLRTINTYYIAEPVYADAKNSARHAEQLRNIIHQTASERLSMKQLKLQERNEHYIPSRICQPAFDLKADACLVVTFRNFADRVGSGGTADFATVDYAVELVRVSDKRVVWSDSVAFQDQPVTSDLFAAEQTAQHKGNAFQYATASKVVEKSLADMFQNLDQSRTNQFLAK